MSLSIMENYKEWSPIALRAIAGFIFFMAGLSKLMDPAGMTEAFAGMGIPAAAFSLWLVAIVELLGGVLLFVGLFTRWIAIPLGVIMLVAIFATLPNGFMGAWTPMFGFAMMISMFLSGAGKLSLDEYFFK